MPEAAPQLSLVAYLESRPAGLTRVVETCSDHLTRALGSRYAPSSRAQIHATIVGLERVPGTRGDNANLARLRGRRRPMDIPGYLEALGDEGLLPASVRLGGFARGDRPFDSRGATPWERTFSFQAGRAVLIGWPVRPGPPERYPDTLDRLRRRAAAFNILHAYHPTRADVDNDLYLRLGTVAPGADGSAELDGVAAELRATLLREPVTVPLTRADLRVAVYRDPALPPDSTRSVPLVGLRSAEAIEALYDLG